MASNIYTRKDTKTIVAGNLIKQDVQLGYLYA